MGAGDEEMLGDGRPIYRLFSGGLAGIEREAQGEIVHPGNRGAGLRTAVRCGHRPLRLGSCERLKVR